MHVHVSGVLSSPLCTVSLSSSCGGGWQCGGRPGGCGELCGGSQEGAWMGGGVRSWSIHI